MHRLKSYSHLTKLHQTLAAKGLKNTKCVFNDDCRAIIFQPYLLQNHLNEFIKPYLLNATSPQAPVIQLYCQNTNFTRARKLHATLLAEPFFFCFAPFFWCTEERLHVLSKIFARHVLLVAKIKVSAQA